MSDWKREARKVASGRWIRFDSQNPTHTLLFLGEPTKVEKTSQMGPSKGEKYFQMSFPVLEDGDEKILEPNKSLLTQLIEEDDEETIIGAELLIKCLNPEKKTQWKIRRIAGNHSDIQTWKQEKRPAKDDDEEEEVEEKKPAQDSKDKDKFMEGVKNTRAKKKPKKEEVANEEGAELDDGSAEEAAELTA